MQQGITLYLTIAIIAGLSSALLALVSLSLSQIKVMWTIGDSVVAFYAADTGIEEVLYKLYKTGEYNPVKGECPYSGTLSIGADSADYKVCCTSVDPLRIQSTGTFKNTKRRIEIKF